MPKRDDLKVVASGSLLMATMFLTWEMPAMCWLAPEMATAMYRSGVTTLPVRPICVATGYHPRSQTARVAPTAPPSRLASSSSGWEPPGPPTPRAAPPPTGRPQPRPQPRRQVAPHHRLAEQHDGGVGLLADTLRHRDVGVAKVVLQHRIVHHDHLVGAGGGAVAGQPLHARSQQSAGYRATQAVRRCYELPRHRRQGAVFRRLSENEYSVWHGSVS